MKALRGNKVSGGLRRVFVSWRLKRPQALDWKDEFWTRLQLDTGQMQRSFAACVQTGDAESGTLLQQWFEHKLDPGGTHPITDVVAVLSNEYLVDNTDRDGKLAEGELSRFFDHITQHDRLDTMRVYLAPLDAMRWELYAVRKVRLQDAQTKHRWLVRLQAERFTWPYQDPMKSSDEVAKAVQMITD